MPAPISLSIAFFLPIQLDIAPLPIFPMNQSTEQPHEERADQLPWGEWDLDKKFFRSFYIYFKENPQSTLDKVLDQMFELAEAGKDIHDAIPDDPFPAKTLVIVLSNLIRLGNTITQTKEAVWAFVMQVATWVEEICLIIDADGVGTSIRWQRLRNSRDSINEICGLAQSRLADGRWSQIDHRLIEEEINGFKHRLSESRMSFQDPSSIHDTFRRGYGFAYERRYY